MKLVVSTFLSMDGVMQGPGQPDEDRSNGFDHGGWQFPYADDDMGAIVVESFAAMDALLLGRRTYDILAGYWPTKTDPADPIATRLNQAPKYVVSTTLDTVEWHNSHLVKGDVAAGIRELKRQPGNELVVIGSGDLAQTLMAHDLVDEYRLWYFPVVLGDGKRLFAAGCLPTALQHLSTQHTSSGSVLLTYRPVGRPSYGSF